MTRTGRGGKRNGTPGVAHPQRTDLNAAPQPITAAPGQPHGVAGAQREAQRAVPMAGAPAPPNIRPPGSAGPLDRPSERPGEPITAGLPIGPGPGPESLGMPMTTPEDELRAIYLRTGAEEIRELIEEMEAG